MLLVKKEFFAKLIFVLFGCLPLLANSYGHLSKAQNVYNLMNRTETAIFENKWANCGPDLVISPEGLGAMRRGQHKKCPSYLYDDEERSSPNSVRAQMPVRIFKGGIMPKKPYITGYYEVEILVKDGATIPIGFSDQHFPLDSNFIGNDNNSIGTWHKAGIHIDGRHFYTAQRNDEGVRAGDVMGCGIVHFPKDNLLKFFFTSNGQLLGSAILPPKFLHIPIFATATMWTPGDSIWANFGKQNFSADLVEILAELI